MFAAVSIQANPYLGICARFSKITFVTEKHFRMLALSELSGVETSNSEVGGLY
jgi:hypothetical protein